MPEQIKTSELSSYNISNTSTQFIVFVDTSNTGQASSGSTLKAPISSINSEVWGLSANYNVDKISSIYTTVNSNSAINWAYQGTDVKLLTSDWVNISTVVKTNSAGWEYADNLSGGTANQILAKTNNNSTFTWTNKRVINTKSTISSTQNVLFNALSADHFIIPLSSNGSPLTATFGFPSNGYNGQLLMWDVRNLTNNCYVSLSSNFRSPVSTLSWSNSVNKMDILAAKYNQLDNKWDIVSFLPGYSL